MDDKSSFIINDDFKTHMTQIELEAMTNFVSGVKNVLGHQKVAKYYKKVAEMLKNKKKIS